MGLVVIILEIIAYYIVLLFFKIDVLKLFEISPFVDAFTLDTNMSLLDLIIFILINIFFVGFAEELMFRGFVQKSFESNHP